MKKKLSIILMAAVLGTYGCKDSEFLDIAPTNTLTVDQIFQDANQTLSVMANLYNRYADFSTVKDWATMADFNECFVSDGGGFSKNNGWDYNSWYTWDYNYIRDLNLFIERATASTGLAQADKDRFIAEARFLRASYYFEIVKRVGGVPLILKSLTYDFSGDPTYLQSPRNKEAEIYDFVISEAEAIKTILPKTPDTKSRATAAAALAMESRAALYAGSIAKYGASTPNVSLPGEEVGIPSGKASGYYTTALRAAKEIIDGSVGAYSLYKKKDDLAENFASIFLDKGSNTEVIFVDDFKLKSGKVHGFTLSNQPRYGAQEEEGGRINPSLNFVETFEKLDNSYAPIPITSSNGQPIVYTNQLEPFAGRDARLAGTVLLPSMPFRGLNNDIFAGVQLTNGTVITADDRGLKRDVPGKGLIQVVGFDGPINNKVFTAQSGFYIRKYLDPAPGAGQRGVNSEVWFVRYRYAEVLLNAAEASFELGDATSAASYINQVRARAGLVTPLTSSQITFDRVVHERRVELAFEGHLLFDYKRWRIAHQVFDGNTMTEADLLSNIGKATKRSTQPYGLWPYKLIDPNGPNDGKWIFKIVLPSEVQGSDRFLFGNYYTRINTNEISNNPKLIQNPNQ
ncbi:RagB/SusD family nutrient uptake outer membrane protein [Mucilaginibacter gynuensis]|uniref:RagB/SusD family nutrient uptake outer membrane protein n=1 Tax=Mucilaginibacter gynuensis TaxID=1302236 RepID=A0ABP8FLV8_9SPHI